MAPLMVSHAGSSPRMRGALTLTNSTAMRTRIIPAYAGSTWQYTSNGRVYRDHPRVCGEHCMNASMPI